MKETESKIIRDDGVQQADSTFVNATEELNLKRCINLKETPAGISILRTYLLHIL